MNTWRMNGSLHLAVSPSAALLVGTVRQPRTGWPSDWMICSKRSSSRRRWVTLRGRNTSPLAYSPGPGSAMRAFRHTSLRKAWGICSSTPAPSPVFGSLPAAPRWSRLINTCGACCRIWWDRRPFMSTTKPTPHASCSNQGS